MKCWKTLHCIWPIVIGSVSDKASKPRSQSSSSSIVMPETMSSQRTLQFLYCYVLQFAVMSRSLISLQTTWRSRIRSADDSYVTRQWCTCKKATSRFILTNHKGLKKLHEMIFLRWLTIKHVMRKWISFTNHCNSRVPLWKLAFATNADVRCELTSHYCLYFTYLHIWKSYRTSSNYFTTVTHSG